MLGCGVVECHEGHGLFRTCGWCPTPAKNGFYISSITAGIAALGHSDDLLASLVLSERSHTSQTGTTNREFKEISEQLHRLPVMHQTATTRRLGEREDGGSEGATSGKAIRGSV